MTWLDQPILAVDCESTGVDPETARIITACIGSSRKPGDWLPREIRINPGVPIPEGASAVHGITDDLVAGWPSPTEPHALPAILAELTYAAAHGVPVVGHNLAYDLTLLDREMRRHLGAPLPEGLLILDTLVLFRRFDFTTGGRRLEQLAARYGITFPAHDAAADALASLRLLHILARDNDLLPLVSVRDLQPLQTTWHAAHQTAAACRRLGNGQSTDGFDPSWPLRPYPESEAAA